MVPRILNIRINDIYLWNLLVPTVILRKKVGDDPRVMGNHPACYERGIVVRHLSARKGPKGVRFD